MTAKKNEKVTSQFARYLGPVMAAIRELGGTGRPDEVRAVIARQLTMSEAEQSEALPSGVQTRFENQVHWARFYLAKAGYIDSSQRGVWTLTEKGRQLGEVTDDDVQTIVKDVNAQTRGGEDEGVDAAPSPSGAVPVTGNYREELARTLQALPAAGLERFCQRLLRESGFQEVTVTGQLAGMLEELQLGLKPRHTSEIDEPLFGQFSKQAGGCCYDARSHGRQITE